MGTLGTFKVTGGKLIVTDPCYGKGTWCQGILKNVSNGEWNADIEIVGNRVAKLHIKAVDQMTHGAWHDEDFDVGVDSGQAGFFSLNKFPDGGQDSPFYDACCNITISSNAGIIDGFGVVSSTGWGDGGYLCRTRKNSTGKIVEAEIVFIDEDEHDMQECEECGEKFAAFDMDGDRCISCDRSFTNVDDDSEEV